MFNKGVEVLAPAGSEEALIAAVRSGADAVYLGVKSFSARRNAENFDDEALEKAVKYCHINGVKVYLTLNILLKDSELEVALNTARFAYRCGIDGAILQDLGIAEAIHYALPDLELHASTQMSIHSSAALPILKKMGFCRVVAAREMNFVQLKDFCKVASELNMQVEVFVHGALCMSVSGQCFLSSMLGARSGNRGLCAGPCRLPFSAAEGNEYALSLKDLSLLKYTKELIEMGVTSFKIEGRMKRPEYIAAATAACRQAVDSGSVSQELNSALYNVFSRSGFTDGYFTSNIGKEMFGIRTKEDVIVAKEAFSVIHSLYRNEKQRIPIYITAEILSEKPMKISFSDGVNIVDVYGNIPQAAKKREVCESDVKAGLEKLGGTAYFAKEIKIVLESGLFVADSQLNALRRGATELLNAKRADVKKRRERDLAFCQNSSVSRTKSQFTVRLPDCSLIEKLPSDIHSVIIPIKKIDTSYITNSIRIIAEIPRWIDDEKQICSYLDKIKKIGIKTAFCSSISAVAIAKKAGFEIVGGIGLNIANSNSLKVIFEMGVSEAVLSPEISISQLSVLNTTVKKGIFAYGRLPLMLLKCCPLKISRKCAECDKKGFLTDRKGIHFPIACSEAYCELLNSKPIFLADRQNEIGGIDFQLLYFTNETSEEIIRVIYAYLNGSNPFNDYTRGLYYRNLL